MDRGCVLWGWSGARLVRNEALRFECVSHHVQENDLKIAIPRDDARPRSTIPKWPTSRTSTLGTEHEPRDETRERADVRTEGFAGAGLDEQVEMVACVSVGVDANAQRVAQSEREGLNAPGAAGCEKRQRAPRPRGTEYEVERLSRRERAAVARVTAIEQRTTEGRRVAREFGEFQRCHPAGVCKTETALRRFSDVISGRRGPPSLVKSRDFRRDCL